MCCNKGWCARWFIGIVNLAVIICAVVAAVVIYKKEQDTNWINLVKNNVPFIFLLVAAGFAVLSALIGFFLCCCKKKCLNVTYLIIIFIVIILEVVAIVLAFLFGDDIINGIGQNWYSTNEEMNKTRFGLEELFRCCGFENHTEAEYHFYRNDCGYPGWNPTTNATCFVQLKDNVNKNMSDLKIGVIVMGVIELILLFCAIYLVCCRKKDDKEGIAKF